MASGRNGVTEGTVTPERTRLRKGNAPGRVQGWVAVYCIAWCYSSRLCDTTRVSRFTHARLAKPSGHMRRVIGRAKRTTDGCLLFVTPRQQGGLRCPPAGGPYRRIVSWHQATLMIRFNKNRITRNATTPNAK